MVSMYFLILISVFIFLFSFIFPSPVHISNIFSKKTNSISLVQALAVIEYLVANGSERAVDDIVEHTYQIAV